MTRQRRRHNCVSRTRCTVLYSDIRNFTSFAEANVPERVVQFLNRTMTIIVDAITRADGDVDKLIGDAFWRASRHRGGSARHRRARDAIRLVEQAGLPRGVGIGIYTGEVISGTVGSADRMDFTVIGDSVNLAARLCSAAARGEDFELARQVADQLMAKDALAAHARDELGISEISTARPVQAALMSAATFTVGAAMPLLTVLVSPPGPLVAVVAIASLAFLALLGAVGAKAGGADVLKATARVTFWGALAMGLTAGIGAIFGTVV